MSQIEEYYVNLQQDIRFSAENEESPESMSHAFTEYVTDLLADAGEINNAIIGLLVKPKIECSAVDWDDEREILTVFTTKYSNLPDISTFTKVDLSPTISALSNFVVHASQDLSKHIDESQPVHDVILEIKEFASKASKIRLVVLTNRMLKTQIPKIQPIFGKETYLEIWDLDRVHKLDSSGNPQEPVSIEFSDFDFDGLPFVGPFGNTEEYSAYLGIVPGRVLSEIYGIYGPRLLELNVRSFLQARGKVNKGMQETLKHEPENFLAYNNGLSLTASAVEIESVNGSSKIVRVNNVQIVNGGQTTASLYRAASFSKLDLSDVEVQFKLTVVDDATVHGIAGRISEYSNAQNPVRMADFTANDKFHVELERLSRNIWAPGRDGSGQLTRWFFERARGQYADAVARELTPARQRKFKSEHPVSQKLLKTDVAKYEMMWSQRPEVVSLGAEKCFREFLQDRKDRSVSILPDQDYFERLGAKAILWRRTEALITKMQLGGYRAATVAYTLSLLSRATKQLLDLPGIWQAQDLSPELVHSIQSLAPLVHGTILRSAGTRNVTEWAKRKECWADVQKIDWQPPASITVMPKNKYVGPKLYEHAPEEAQAGSADETAILKEVVLTPSHTWKAISGWAKESSNLNPFQRSLSLNLGKMLSEGRAPSMKQAVHGKKILDEVVSLGFDLRADYSPVRD